MIAWALATVGCTIILTQSRIFRFLQKLGFLFRCPMCMGFWVGLLASQFLRWGICPTLPWHLRIVADGCAVSLLSWVTAVVLHKLGADEL